MLQRYREIIPADIPMVNEWLVAQKLDAIQEVMYPPTGLIMQDRETGESVYAGFVWVTNSKLFQIGFITRNTQYRKTEKNEQTLQNFIERLVLYARELGAEYVITWAENKNIVADCKKIGFLEASNRTSELILNIS